MGRQLFWTVKRPHEPGQHVTFAWARGSQVLSLFDKSIAQWAWTTRQREDDDWWSELSDAQEMYRLMGRYEDMQVELTSETEIETEMDLDCEQEQPAKRDSGDVPDQEHIHASHGSEVHSAVQVLIH